LGSIIKAYVDLSITKFNNEYDATKINNIFERAFTFDYTKIHSELKDRIIFIQ
jgi:hypothetical protein